jgi:DNA-directed RNA polymerase specialized sigma subunit
VEKNIMNKLEISPTDCTSDIPDIDASIQDILSEYHELSQEEEASYMVQLAHARVIVSSRSNVDFTPEEQVVIDQGKDARNALFHSVSMIMVKCSLMALKEVDGYITKSRKESAISEGVMAAYYAIDRFDPARGTRLTTYTYPVVIDRVKKYLKTKEKMFSTSDRDVAMHDQISREVRLARQHNEPVTIDTIYEKIKGTYLGITRDNVVEIFDHLNTSYIELDEPFLDGDDTHGEIVSSDRMCDRPPEQITLPKIAMDQTLDGAGVTEKERLVWALYNSEERYSFGEIGRMMGWSSSWARKLHDSADAKLQRYFRGEEMRSEGVLTVERVIETYRPFLEAMSASSYVSRRMFGVSSENGYHNQAEEAYMLVINCLGLRQHFPENTEFELRNTAFLIIERYLDLLWEQDHPGEDGLSGRRLTILKRQHQESFSSLLAKAESDESIQKWFVDHRLTQAIHQQVFIGAALGLETEELAALFDIDVLDIRRAYTPIRKALPEVATNIHTLEGRLAWSRCLEDTGLFPDEQVYVTAQRYLLQKALLPHARVFWLYAIGYSKSDIIRFVGKPQLGNAEQYLRRYVPGESMLDVANTCLKLGIFTPWDMEKKPKQSDGDGFSPRMTPTRFEYETCKQLLAMSSSDNPDDIIHTAIELGYDLAFTTAFFKNISVVLFRRPELWRDHVPEMRKYIETKIPPLFALVLDMWKQERSLEEIGKAVGITDRYVLSWVNIALALKRGIPLNQNIDHLIYEEARDEMREHLAIIAKNIQVNGKEAYPDLTDYEHLVIGVLLAGKPVGDIVVLRRKKPRSEDEPNSHAINTLTHALEKICQRHGWVFRNDQLLPRQTLHELAPRS